MSSIKSISVVNTSIGWAARQRNVDGSELFVFATSPGQRYTMHEAQCAADSLRRHVQNGGETYAEPLPSSARVLKS